jgi:transcriptional regulator with XRE-family HTH domain
MWDWPIGIRHSRTWTLASRDKFNREYRAIIAMLQSHPDGSGMIQWDLARALGTDQSQISKLERSERRLDIVDFLRICRAIGRDPEKRLRSADFVKAARK